MGPYLGRDLVAVVCRSRDFMKKVETKNQTLVVQIKATKQEFRAKIEGFTSVFESQFSD